MLKSRNYTPSLRENTSITRMPKQSLFPAAQNRPWRYLTAGPEFTWSISLILIEKILFRLYSIFAFTGSGRPLVCGIADLLRQSLARFNSANVQQSKNYVVFLLFSFYSHSAPYFFYVSYVRAIYLSLRHSLNTFLLQQDDSFTYILLRIFFYVKI